MLPVPRTSRYSGSERPAWRMNHTGTCGAGRLRQASRNGAPAGGGIAVTVPRPGPGARRRDPRIPRAPSGDTPVDIGAPRAHDGAMRRDDGVTGDSGERGLADALGQGRGGDASDGGFEDD